MSKSRENALEVIGPPYDLVIIGGGITGAGIARDATLRGLRVALFEKGDFGSGTSSKSSKLIHGGLRYLERGEIGLVFESVSERSVQLDMAPHLVTPLPFLVPIYKESKPGLELINLGLWIYDTLALFRSPKIHKTFRGARAQELEPLLDPDGLRGAIEYYDCITDDARLVLENVLDAHAHGAVCQSYCEVVGLERTDDSRVRAVRVRDVLTGEEKSVACRAVILAAGAWTDEASDRLGIVNQRRLLRRTKGVHLVFAHEKLPLRRAITLTSPIDGRVMFAIPWRGRTVLGTTDTDFEGTADRVVADPADARYLCDSANHYFPAGNFQPEDAISSWAGLRPLVYDEEAESAGEVSREHEIFVRDDGIVIIAGGKLTTYRRMAKQAVRAAIKWLQRNHRDLDRRTLSKPRTKKRPLPGAVGLAERSVKGIARLARSIADQHGIDLETASHLCQVYGVRARILVQAIAKRPDLGQRMVPDLPNVWAEVEFAVQHDLARTIDDVLSRRTLILLTARDQGLDVVEQVASIMGELLSWTSDRQAAEIARYRDAVAASRCFRQPANQPTADRPDRPLRAGSRQ